MPRTSARVEFIGQPNGNGFNGGYFCPRIHYIKVDRTFPQILEYYKTVHEWTEACQKFDRAFRPINTANARCFITLDKVGKAIFAIGILLLIYSIVTSNVGEFGGILMIAGPLAYMVCRIVSKRMAWKTVEDSLRKSCGRESEINEAVSFYLRQEDSLRSRHYYIECIVEIANDGNASDALESGMNLASIPVATVVNDSSVYTEAVVASDPVASAPVDVGPVDVSVNGSARGNGMNTTSNRSSDDRLRDLENIASMLTEEEYDSSLQMVLSSETSGSMSNGVSIVDQIEELERSRQSREENDYKTKKSNLLKQL
jgi:hypothetical protein